MADTQRMIFAPDMSDAEIADALMRMVKDEKKKAGKAEKEPAQDAPTDAPEGDKKPIMAKVVKEE